jgi:hypothetical protein
MVKKIVMCALCCMFTALVLNGMHDADKKHDVIKNGKDFDKIVRARDDYKNSKHVGMSDLTKGNRINHEPVQQSDIKTVEKK